MGQCCAVAEIKEVRAVSSPSVRFNQAGDIPNYISKTYCHIIFPFFPRLAELAFSVRFHHQITVYISLLPLRAACQAHLLLFYLITVKGVNITPNTNIYRRETYTAASVNPADIIFIICIVHYAYTAI